GQVTVTDAVGNTTSAVNIFVNPLPAISPSGYTMAVNPDMKNFSPVGGTGPYTFSVIAGTGTVNANTGAYTAPVSPTTDTLKMVDADGNSVTVSIQVNPALSLAPTS